MLCIDSRQENDAATPNRNKDPPLRSLTRERER